MTVVAAIAYPSWASSPWILQWPQAGFSRAIRMISVLTDVWAVALAGAGWCSPICWRQGPVRAQDRGRSDREDLRPLAAVHQPGQRREPEPASMVQLQPSAGLAAKYLVLAAKHEEFGVMDKSDRTSTASRPNRHLRKR
jgi:hypothetical protein